tara:strand:- start:134 stop:463 length:330 start_codon:yes stop_codon:yes gene_type:complete
VTRSKVIQLGLLVLLLGGLGYVCFRSLGLDEASAGIAAEAVLVLIVLGWTGSYFFRVVTGKMTFIEQRKRYRKEYDQLTKSKLQEKFDNLPEEDQIRLIKELEEEKNVF